MAKTIKNDILLKVLNNETVIRPPVWMMRQAGRYLPGFMAIKEKYDFFTRCRTPELASDITIQPVDIVGVDAAILFSDILVVPQAMNIPFEMTMNQGPWLENPVRTKQDVDQVIVPDVNDSLKYVMDAIQLTNEKLNGSVPLIGFAGSPWTILCYCVEGKGSKNFDIAKGFCFTEPGLAYELLQKITDTTIAYLKAQVLAGVDVVQVFDSWGGMLSYDDYMIYSWPYIKQIVDELSTLTKVIVFAKGCWFALSEMIKSPVSALGVDWTCPAYMARELTQNKVVLQGNFDPVKLLSPVAEIEKQVIKMIQVFGSNYIVNLGHGILPNVPVAHAQAFVETVKNYRY